MLARVERPTRGFERLAPDQQHQLADLLRQVIRDDAAA
jgi:hypothetical protein